MNRLFLIVVVFFKMMLVQAQDVRVEKDIVGVQLGLFGANLYNEHKLSDVIALRSQLSLEGGFRTGTVYDKTGFWLYPALSLETKWYYGQYRRVKKGKNISNNSGNYLSFKAQYSPDWFVISNESNLMNNNVLYLMPTFGIRRSFSKHFNYEFSIGYGFAQELGKNAASGTALMLGFKVGYDFYKR